MTNEKKAFRLFLAAALLLFLGGKGVEHLYNKSAPPRVDRSQPHYRDVRQLPEVRGHLPFFWAELGRNGKAVSELTNAPGSKLAFKGFQIGSPWPREVSWHIDSNLEGAIQVTFPPRDDSNVHKMFIGLFLTDGDGFERLVSVKSGRGLNIAQELHDGRWLLLPLTAAERTEGRVTIHFNRVAGDSVALSAITIYDIPEEAK